MDIDEPTMDRQAATCACCRQPFEALFMDFCGHRIAQRFCEGCIASQRQLSASATSSSSSDAVSRAGKARWDAFCPRTYRTEQEGGETSLARLLERVTLHAEVMGHPYGPQGLILRGPTGSGKTRMMFRLLRSYLDANRRMTMRHLSAGEFDRQARDAAGQFRLSEWFDDLAKSDVLFVDDLGKGKWTEATAGQFWELVDSRSKHAKPIFLTTNCSGDTMAKAMRIASDISEPLLRRLRETCKVIVLT